MPRSHPRAFREDVVAVARRGEAPIAEIARGFGISESCLRNWLAAAEVEAGLPRRRSRLAAGRAFAVVRSRAVR